MLRPNRRRQPCKHFEKCHQHAKQRVRGDPYHIEWQHDAGQRERNDCERHRGNRDGVRQRRYQRKLLEQRERRRHEADRHDPLRARPFAQDTPYALTPRRRRSGTQPAAAREEQQTHGAERQPEARRERRPRIPRQNRHERPQPHGRRGPGPSEPQAERADPQHQQRAHRRDFRTGEQHIREREERADERGEFACRDRRRDARAPSRDDKRQSSGQRREHRDVQSRDADQMRNARSVEDEPLRFRDRTLIAD